MTKAAATHDFYCRCRACKPPLVGQSRGNLRIVGGAFAVLLLVGMLAS